MAGKIYNSWLVIEPVPGTNKSTGGLIWKAKCLECNNIYEVKGANIRSGMSKRCIQCGCKHGHTAQKEQIRTKRTAKESALHYLFLKLRKDAKKRKLDWTLTSDDVKSLVFSNCYYCGIKPNLVCQPLKHQGLSQKRTKKATIVRNGIDRIDSSKGYVQGNVAPCCQMCNTAKTNRTVEEFTEWAFRLSANLLKTHR